MSNHADIPVSIQDTDIFAFISSPVQASALQCAITVAGTQFQRLQQARTEADQLRDAFAARKIIDRAKGLVMQRQGVSEGDAYMYLRDESRRQRTPIVDIAKSILDDVEETMTPKASHAAGVAGSARRPVSQGVSKAIRG